MTKTEIIRRALLKAAESGAPCPTNPELGRLVGLKHRESAERHLRELREADVIQVQKQGQTKRRICVDGQWTDWTRCGPMPVEQLCKVRRCLTCRKKFDSEWDGNRICKRCKATAEWRGAAMA